MKKFEITLLFCNVVISRTQIETETKIDAEKNFSVGRFFGTALTMNTKEL